MSSGLMCLDCRAYISVTGQEVDPRWGCQCPLPNGSWDGKTPHTTLGNNAEYRQWLAMERKKTGGLAAPSAGGTDGR